MSRPPAPLVDAHDAALLRQVRDGLRELADHDVPAIRGPARLALAEVEQILNSQLVDYSLYSGGLRRAGGPRRRSDAATPP